MKAWVFLNEADGHWFGFQPDHVAGCTAVGEVSDLPDDDHEALEAVFYMLNTSTGYEHRSLSVGDVVVLMDDERSPASQRAYACASCGWDELTPNPFRFAVGVAFATT